MRAPKAVAAPPTMPLVMVSLCSLPNFLADAMTGSAAAWNPSVKGPVPFAAQAFLYSSLAYPLVYVPCVLGWFILRRLDRQDVALRVSGIPLFYLLILAVEFAAWASVQRPIHP